MSTWDLRDLPHAPRYPGIRAEWTTDEINAFQRIEAETEAEAAAWERARADFGPGSRSGDAVWTEELIAVPLTAPQRPRPAPVALTATRRRGRAVRWLWRCMEIALAVGGWLLAAMLVGWQGWGP